MIFPPLFSILSLTHVISLSSLPKLSNNIPSAKKYDFWLNVSFLEISVILLEESKGIPALNFEIDCMNFKFCHIRK